MAEVRVVKICAQVGYIKSCLTDDKSPQKGGWLGSHDPFFACVTKDLKLRLET